MGYYKSEEEIIEMMRHEERMHRRDERKRKRKMRNPIIRLNLFRKNKLKDDSGYNRKFAQFRKDENS